jgi:hypothetical protein
MKETLSKRMATTMLQTYSCLRIATRVMDYYSNSMDILEVCYSIIITNSNLRSGSDGQLPPVFKTVFLILQD